MPRGRAVSTGARQDAGPAAARATVPALAVALLVLGAACTAAPRAPTTVVMASGSDLESANPLVTVHPLSRQVQRYVLLVTLARYDRAMQPVPYLARRWEWTDDRRTLVLHLFPALRWHDGALTTAADARFTILRAADPRTGYPRQADLAGIRTVSATDDSTLVLRFAAPQARFPTVLCELPLVPEHLLAGVPPADMRRARFGTAPVGNGPFRFVARTAGARWIFERVPDFPAELGGPPRIQRLVVAVVDEATTKFAGLVSGELDVAGISPIMASLVARDPSLRVLTYPVLFSTGIVFNAHRPPFDDVRVRRAIGLSLRRDRIVEAAVAGLATPGGRSGASGQPARPRHRAALRTGARRLAARRRRLAPDRRRRACSRRRRACAFSCSPWAAATTPSSSCCRRISPSAASAWRSASSSSAPSSPLPARPTSRSMR